MALGPKYRISLNFTKSYILSCLSKFCNKKKFHRAVFEMCQTLFCMFFPWTLHRFRDITYAKNPVFVVMSARDHKDGNFTSNPANYWSFATCNLKKCWFQVKTIKILISRNAQARQCWYQVIYRQLKFWFHIITPPQGLNLLGLRVPSFIRVRVRDYLPKLGLALKVRVTEQG